jgi:hypothetical protein
MYIALLPAFAANAHAQGLIWVKGNVTDALFSDATAAVQAAQPGDKIYLPGGAFALPDIGKELHIVGVGWDRRMTAATGPTFIANQTVTFGLNAANSSIEGVRFSDLLKILTGNVTVKRCHIPRLEVGENMMGNLFVQNVILAANVKPTVNTQTVAYFYNNVMRDLNVWTNSRADIANNVFIRPVGQALYIKNGVFRKNIVLRGLPYGVYECINVLVEDNVFSTDQTLNGSGLNCPQSGNLAGIPAEDIFENVPSETTTFSETLDFRLKPNSPARFGTPENADDAGIYGGDYPWKDGLLPANPHVDAKLAPPSAAGNNLNVRLRVSAQSE